MPTIILTESSVAEDGAIELINPKTGELTVEAQAVSDFLTHVDFSRVAELSEFADLSVKAKLDVGESEDEEFVLVPGDMVAEAVDMDDLVGMFEHYILDIIDQGDNDKSTLEQTARAVALFQAFGEPLAEGAFPKGRGKMRKAWNGNKKMQSSAISQMLAMRKKGVYVKGKDGKNHYAKKKGSSTGKAKVAMFKQKNKAKIIKARKRRGMKAEGAETEQDTPIEDAAIFGLGEPCGAHRYEASPRDDANERLAEAKKKGMKSMGKPAMPKMAPGKCESNDPRTRTIGEGASLAGSILAINESRSGTMSAAMKTP